MHGSPLQQSAVVEHVWPVCWQAVPEHTILPVASGVHGRLQQSALDAHAVPAGGGLFVQSTPVPVRQRGMPRLS